MERARRVSKSISRPFAEDWSSDEEDEEEETDPLSLFAVSKILYFMSTTLKLILAFLLLFYFVSSYLLHFTLFLDRCSGY